MISLEEKQIIHAFKEAQRKDWIKRYTRLNIKLNKKYINTQYCKEHNNEFNKAYARILKNWEKRWQIIFELPWGSI